jgi:hypothetical protein
MEWVRLLKFSKKFFIKFLLFSHFIFLFLSLLLLTIYNVGDITGKWIAGFRQFYNGTLMILVTVGRIVFFFTFHAIIV